MEERDQDDEVIQLLDRLALDWKQKYAGPEKQSSNPEAGVECAVHTSIAKPNLTSSTFQTLAPFFEQSSFQSILVALLKDVVKPRLSEYKHAKLTDRATQRIRPRPETTVPDEINPPIETIQILNWVSKNIDKTTIQTNFHLILPPILILLDSSHANIRTHATIILSHILDRINHSILARTGLAEVFWTAITPNLASLPPITDLEQSVPLLQITYPTSVKLAQLWHPSLSDRIPLLDKLVRDGIIYAMLYSGEKIKVAQIQMESIILLVHEMGIHFTKHLKHVIPIISSILANPLASNHPPLLLLAVESLETIIQICWPRIGYHHVEVLRGTTTCWRYLCNQDDVELVPVRDALKRVSRALIAASAEIKMDAEAIASIDPYYAELF